MKKIFWLVGEISGDIHAAKVIEKLNITNPNFEHIGIGGPRMQAQNFKTLFPFEKFNIMGFIEVVAHLKFFMKVEKTIKNYFIENKPDLVVLVDYPGLNLRIAKIASNLNLTVFYYICPQFWAWKHKRIYKLKEYCDHVACIFPFEKESLDIHRINSTFVGHPIIEDFKFEITKEELCNFYGIDKNKRIISFFPGSRIIELKKHLPIFLETIKLLKKDYVDCEFLISKSKFIKHKAFMEFINLKDDVKIIDAYNHELVKYSDFLVIKSGTSTLEAATIGTPFIIIYKANKISYHIAKNLIKLKYIGLPNIVMKRKIVEELIQDDVNPKNISNTIKFFLNDNKEYQELKENLSNFKQFLGDNIASLEVSKIILKLLNF